MTPAQFTAALAALQWKQSDFCRKTGTNKATPSNWSLGHTPIPLWVDAYLGAMQDLAAFHGKYLATAKPTAAEFIAASKLTKAMAKLEATQVKAEKFYSRQDVQKELMESETMVKPPLPVTD